MNIICRMLFVAIFVAFAFPATAVADGPDLSGTYSYDEENSDDMMEAFTPAIDAMSRMRRGFARRAVRNQDDPPAQIKIEQSDDEIAIHAGDSPVIRAPLNGETVDYVNKDGETEKVTARLDDDAVEVHRDFDDGEYRTRYRLSTSGQRLGIFSKIDMDALPKVVNYRRAYDRR